MKGGITMTKKLKVSFLLVLLAFVIGIASYETYAYLTDSDSFEIQYTIGKIEATVNVTGATNTELTVINEDLAYIHYVDDFITNNVAYPNKFIEYVASGMKVIATPYVTDVAMQITDTGIGCIVTKETEEVLLQYTKRENIYMEDVEARQALLD